MSEQADSDSYSDSDEASSRFHKSVLSSLQKKQPKKRSSPIITQEGDFDSTMAETNNGFIVQQAQPMTTTASAGVKRTRSLQSSNASASSDKGTIAAAASQLFARPLSRRRSSLFGDLPAGTGTRSRMDKDKSVSSFPQRLFSQEASQSTLLASENEESQLPASKKPPAGSSLFGAVMRNFGSASSGGGSESITSTPTKARRNENDGEQSNLIFSPKGNTIMNMVNKFVMASPFRFQSPNAKRALLSNTDTNTNTNNYNNSNPAPHTPSPRKKRRRLDMNVAAADSRSSLHDDDHWHEASLDTQQLTILDWSLKKQLKLECHPKHCLANITSSPQWDASLQYWQYPAAPMPSFLLLLQQQQQQQQRLATNKPMAQKQRLDNNKTIDERSQVDEKSTLPLSSSSSITIANRLIEAVKGPSQKMEECLDEASSFLDSRRQEWQEALRSIYFKWRQQVQAYDDASISETNTNPKDIPDSATNCYFYCKGTNHVALFRVEYSSDKGCCKPLVILSGASTTFRQTLQDLGAERVDYLEAAHENNVHVESSSPFGKSKSKSSLFPMSPTVKADLEALRRAQAYGETAGADVTVKFKAKHNNNNIASKGSSTDKNQKLPPLMLQGMDDVDLFFEVYLNSLGGVDMSSFATTTNDNTNNDLPWILCRQVGPFAHASLKSLTFHPPTTKQQQKQTQEKTNDDYATLEIYAGRYMSVPILPCAIRELTSVLAKGMAADHAHVHVHDAKRSEQQQHPSVTTKEEEDTESSHHNNNNHHHWILQAIPDRPAIASIVGGGSGWFNRGGIEDDENDDDGENVSSLEQEECRHGQVLQLLAWDVAKKDVVTYKVDSSVPDR
jgi:hypothetical protein